jgi:hypothetical protein
MIDHFSHFQNHQNLTKLRIWICTCTCADLKSPKDESNCVHLWHKNRECNEQNEVKNPIVKTL